MTEVRFYHLESSRVVDEAPKLLEKAYATGLRTLVRCPDAIEQAALDKALWTYDPNSFLPHDTAANAAQAGEQLILISDTQDNGNEAQLLLAINGVSVSDAAEFDRCFYMFNGQDDRILTKARQDWKSLKEQGFDLSYWQKEGDGRWTKKA